MSNHFDVLTPQRRAKQILAHFAGTKLEAKLNESLELSECAGVVDKAVLVQKLRAVREKSLTKALELRERVFEELKKPEYKIDHDWSTPEYREQVHKQFINLMRNTKCVSVNLMKTDLVQFLGALDAVLLYDVNFSAKLVIHMQLFGGSIYDLGTEKHREKYIPGVDNMDIFGCFAMTEIGHGSNVRQIGTLSTFDPKTQEFVINTPDNESVKIWIGNSAKLGTTAVVFARLITQNVDYGVHAFVVPIRAVSGDNSTIFPGIEIMGCGAKTGWHAVDNAAIRFTNVRVPRENLLNKIGDVNPDGTYVSSIKTEGKRFGATLSALMFGRLLYVLGPSRGLEMALTITWRYSNQRRQFGPTGQPEQLIIDYPTYQRKLCPMLAWSYAVNLSKEFLLHRFVKIQQENYNAAELADYHAIVSGVKAHVCEYVVEALGTLRVMCGGHGVLAGNRIGLLRNDFDIFQTAEGDSVVLYQQMGKYLLDQYRKQFSGPKIVSAVKFLASRIKFYVGDMNPLVPYQTSEDHLMDPKFYSSAFSYRTTKQLHNAAMKFFTEWRRLRDPFKAWAASLNEIMLMSKAYVYSFLLSNFIKEVNKCQDKEVSSLLRTVLSLFALTNIEQDMAFFRNEEYIKSNKAKKITSLVTKLCLEVRQKGDVLVEALNIPDFLLKAPLGMSNMAYVDNMVNYLSNTKY